MPKRRATPAPPARSSTLRRAGVLVIAEGVALSAVSGIYTVSLIIGSPASRAIGLFGAALGLLAGVALVLLGRAVGRGRRAALSPVVLAQVLALPIAYTLVSDRQPLAGALIALPAATVLGLLFATPAGRAAFAGPEV